MKKILAAVLAASMLLTPALTQFGADTAYAEFIIEKDAQKAMEKNQEAILDALETMEITNDLTKDEFESMLMGACHYSTNKYVGAGFWMEEFKLVPATESSAGSVRAFVMLNQDRGEVDFYVKKEIPKLGGDASSDNTGDVTVVDVKTAIEKAFANLKVTNSTTDNDILRVIIDAAPSGVSADVDDFWIQNSTKDSDGSAEVKYSMTVPNGESKTLSYKWTVAKLVSNSAKNEVETAKKAINDAIWKFDVSNDTTKADILNMAKNAVAGTDVTVTLDDSDFSVTKATIYANGTVSARLVLSCDDVVAACPIGKTIEVIVTENTIKIDEDRLTIGRALDAITYTNKLTKEGLLNIAKSVAKNGSTVVWKDGFSKRNASFKEDGSIFGYLDVCLNGEAKELLVQHKIPKLVRKLPDKKISVNESEWEILRIANVKRAKENERLLTMPEALQYACDTRELELQEQFSHTRPDGTKCFTAIDHFSYTTAGENIYECPGPKNKFVEINPEKTMAGWMNSPGHRANILNGSFVYLGVGAYDNYEKASAVQLFAANGDQITNVTTSAGTMEFEDEEDMQKEVLICTTDSGLVSYMPLDVDSMTKVDGGYTLKINSSTPVVLKITGQPSMFADVSSDAYYADSVKWALERNITTGTSATAFSPAKTCTRAQIITFIWRAIGSPKPSSANPFSDISENDYYYESAIWASENGMVTGDKFEPNTPCTRMSTVIYLWKNAGSPQAAASVSFSDVAADSELGKAVSWALEKNITNGTTPTTFSPDKICDRGQIVTFLNRAVK